MELSIVIPCYNEEKNIPLLLQRLEEQLDDFKDEIEIIIVDNGSTDNTQNVLKKYLKQYSFARMITVKVNQGYGYGIIKGLEVCQGRYLGWTHADLQTDPKDIVNAYKILEQSQQENLYIKGKRKNRNITEKFFSVSMEIIVSAITGKRLKEINAQPNVFSREFYQSWKNPPYNFSIEIYTLLLAKINNIDIKRFEVELHKRYAGKSSWNKRFSSKINFSVCTIKDAFRIKETIKDE